MARVAVRALALSVLVAGASAWSCQDIKDVCARDGNNPSDTRRFATKCEAVKFKNAQPNKWDWRIFPCPSGMNVLSDELEEVAQGVAGAMVGGQKPASPSTSRSNSPRSPKAPRASVPFPKLDKASCKKYIDMTNQGDDPCKGKSQKSVCSSEGITYPGRCMLEIFICQRIYFPVAGKAPPAFKHDGECAGGMSTACYFPYIKCMNDPTDLKCLRINPTAPINKKNVIYQKNKCYLDMLKACAIPNAVEVKVDVCKAEGSKLPDGIGSPQPMPQFPNAPNGPVSTPMSSRPDPTLACARMKCDPKAVKDEWCGSDGKTYLNICQIKFDNCMKRAKGWGGRRAPSASGGAMKPDYVKPLFKGACPKKCKKASDCGPNMDCVETCVPQKLNKCALLKCKSGEKCKEVCTGKRKLSGRCKTEAKCVSDSAKAQCDLYALQNCYAEAVAANPNMGPCGKFVAQSTCATSSECFNIATLVCNRGVYIQEDGKVKRYIPDSCVSPACASAKVVDPNCQKANYQTCRDKIKNARSNCEGMEAAAKCVESFKCKEDITTMCYIAKNMLGCKGKDLNTVCKSTNSPIKPKEISEADQELFGDYEFMNDGEDASAPQQEGSAAVVAVVACAALLAVGLAAFLLRRRAAAAAPEEEADYQEL